MVDTAGRPVFFIHIMKTGGATFRQHVYANYGPGEVYPYRQLDSDMHAANYDVAYLLGLPPERHAGIRAYTGHFPFVTTELLPYELFTCTILRDPVARTISYLKHCKRYHDRHRELTLEEIYDDEFFFRCFIDNHQSKIFAMTIHDKLQSYMDWIDIDEQRLQIAKTNLAKVDLVGVNERYDEFVVQVRERVGWTIDDLPNRRVGEERWDVDDRLARRIAEDNAADLELYRYALELIGERDRERAEL
jgi:Sulfotransferase family